MKKIIKNVLLFFIGLVVLIIGIASCSSGTGQTTKIQDYNTKAIERFNGLVSANKPNIDRIECPSNDCRGAANFYWNSLPEGDMMDYQSQLKMQAKTALNFQKQNLGTGDSFVIYSYLEGDISEICMADNKGVSCQ